MSRQSIFPAGHLAIDVGIGGGSGAMLYLGESLGIGVDFSHLHIAELADLVPALPSR